jgi:hypothetical protein
MHASTPLARRTEQLMPASIWSRVFGKSGTAPRWLPVLAGSLAIVLTLDWEWLLWPEHALL